MEEITRELECAEPSGAIVGLLFGADVACLTAEQRLTALILVRKNLAALHHLELTLLYEMDDMTEIAMATHEPEQSVVRQKERSAALDRLPRCAELLRRGEIDLRRFETVVDRVVHLGSQEMISRVEDVLVDVAPGLTRSQLARHATKAVAEVDPTGYEQRRQKAKEDRRVEFSPLPDDMAQLKIILPAVDAREVFEVLTQDARDLPKDGRSTDQKRADAFLDRFLGYGIDRKVQVHVTVSLETLMGLTEDPGLLAGYGPVSADNARDLAMQGPWRGVVLGPYRRAEAISTDKYRPTALLKEFATVSAGGDCTAPGCTRPVQELDHVVPWPKGKTTATGIKGLCSWHHHRKTHDNYTVALDAEGNAAWVTPQGRRYTTEPYQY